MAQQHAGREPQPLLLQKARSFILQVSDFLALRMLDKEEAFRILKRTLNFDPDKLALAALKHDTFLITTCPNPTSNAIAAICAWTTTTSRF